MISPDPAPQSEPEASKITPISPAIQLDEPVLDKEALEVQKKHREKEQKLLMAYFGNIEEKLMRRLVAIEGKIPENEDMKRLGSMTVHADTGVRTFWWKGSTILEIGPINDPYSKDLPFDPGSSDS